VRLRSRRLGLRNGCRRLGLEYERFRQRRRLCTRCNRRRRPRGAQDRTRGRRCRRLGRLGRSRRLRCDARLGGSNPRTDGSNRSAEEAGPGRGRLRRCRRWYRGRQRNLGLGFDGTRLRRALGPCLPQDERAVTPPVPVESPHDGRLRYGGRLLLRNPYFGNLRLRRGRNLRSRRDTLGLHRRLGRARLSGDQTRRLKLRPGVAGLRLHARGLGDLGRRRRWLLRSRPRRRWCRGRRSAGQAEWTDLLDRPAHDRRRGRRCTRGGRERWRALLPLRHGRALGEGHALGLGAAKHPTGGEVAQLRIHDRRFINRRGTGNPCSLRGDAAAARKPSGRLEQRRAVTNRDHPGQAQAARSRRRPPPREHAAP